MASPTLIRDAAKQRRKVERLRDQQREATERLGEILVAIRDDDDPDVTLAAAARAMGVSKQTVNSMLAKASR